MDDAICESCKEYSPWCQLENIDNETIYLCDDCKKRKEEREEKEHGTWKVDKCKTCGHIKGIYWKEYKKPGRKKGSKNKPKTPKNVQPLQIKYH